MASPKAVSGALSLFDSIWTAAMRDMTDRKMADRLKAYTLALAQLSDEELTTAAMLCSSRCKFYPLPSDLLEQARPKITAAVASEGAANEAFEAILGCYERGETPGPRQIRERWGLEASHAFLCAGGTAAFTWCEPGRDQAFRQKRFVEGYVEACEDAAAQRLALEAGEKARALTHGESVAALKQIKGGDEA